MASVGLHRAERWGAAATAPIPEAEWRAAVAADPDLLMDSCGAAFWPYPDPNPVGNSEGLWFELLGGAVWVDVPDRGALPKVFGLAARLGGRVEDSEGRFYRAPEDMPLDAPPAPEPEPPLAPFVAGCGATLVVVGAVFIVGLVTIIRWAARRFD